MLANSELTELLTKAKSTNAMPSLAKETIENCDLSDQFFEFPIDFSGVSFAGPAVFKNVGFRAGATFIGTVFDGTADFQMCRFVDYGYFWNSTFRQTASFFRTVFEPVSLRADHPRHPGEANFSYTRFHGGVNFQRARFGGISYFHRTAFEGIADFAEARFDREVRFAGWRNDICVSSDRLPEKCRTYLREQGLACECADNKGYINFDLRIEDAAWLKDALIHPGKTRLPIRRFPFRRTRDSTVVAAPTASNNFLSSQEIQAVVDLYEERRAIPMFSPEHEVSFRSVTVVGGPKGDERAVFSSVKLNLCRFQGCSMAKFSFDEVEWGSRPTTLLLSSRYAIRDENSTRSQSDFYEGDRLKPIGTAHNEERKSLLADDYRSIGRLYRELRRRAEGDGELERAQEFYYGELEMSYRSKSRPRRWFTLLFFYRYFSGFGKQHGLAAAWLFLFILVIFPAGYYLMGKDLKEFRGYPRQTALYAELRSLEASTLLTPSKVHDLGIWGDLLTGLERIVVPSQAALLLLAVKYNFQHKPGD